MMIIPLYSHNHDDHSTAIVMIIIPQIIILQYSTVPCLSQQRGSQVEGECRGAVRAVRLKGEYRGAVRLKGECREAVRLKGECRGAVRLKGECRGAVRAVRLKGECRGAVRLKGECRGAVRLKGECRGASNLTVGQ